MCSCLHLYTPSRTLRSSSDTLTQDLPKPNFHPLDLIQLGTNSLWLWGKYLPTTHVNAKLKDSSCQCGHLTLSHNPASLQFPTLSIACSGSSTVAQALLLGLLHPTYRRRIEFPEKGYTTKRFKNDFLFPGLSLIVFACRSPILWTQDEALSNDRHPVRARRVLQSCSTLKYPRKKN